MKITRKDVEEVAHLGRLQLSEADIEKFTRQLDAILEYADVLNEVDTAEVQPTAHVLPIKNVMRADEVKQSLARDIALENAPEQEEGYFKVPKIMEG